MRSSGRVFGPTAVSRDVQSTFAPRPLRRVRNQSIAPRSTPSGATAIVAVLGIVGTLATMAIVGTIAIADEN